MLKFIASTLIILYVVKQTKLGKQGLWKTIPYGNKTTFFFCCCCCCFSNCTFKFKGKRNYVCPEPCPLHYTQSEPFQIFSVFSLQSLFQISPWEDDCSNTEKKTKRNQIFCKQFQELMMSTTITEKINVCFFSHKLRYTHIFTPLV